MKANFTPVWVESMNGMGHEAVYCPFAVDFCEHFRECKGECGCYRHPVVYVCEHIENAVCTVGRGEFHDGNCHKCPQFSPVPIPHIVGNAANESDDVPERGSIVLVEPGKPARIVTMELSLENLQKTVGGMIQVIYPWDDPVALICNDEGKLLNMPLNRALTDEGGNVYDIVAGAFLICGLSEDNFAGLSEELAKLYSEKFRDAQTFIRRSDGSMAVIVHHTVEGE